MTDIDQLLAEVAKLPADWHTVGVMRMDVLHAIAKHCEGREVLRSVETGSGKTTLLLSHLSRDHTVFAINEYDGEDTRSMTNVKASPLFNAATTRFVEGPSQLTLPQHRFEGQYQLALIDGPHGYPFPDMEYYYLYPRLAEGALLIVDDIDIPTIRHLFDFLMEEEMFRFVEVVGTTAFFRRTASATFSPVLDGWWLQNYNKKRYPLALGPVTAAERRLALVRQWVPPVLRPPLRWIRRLFTPR